MIRKSGSGKNDLLPDYHYPTRDPVSSLVRDRKFYAVKFSPLQDVIFFGRSRYKKNKAIDAKDIPHKEPLASSFKTLPDMPPSSDEEEAQNTYSPFGIPIHPRPVDVTNRQNTSTSVFCLPPIFGPLIFDNTDSDARDHCANERTFLSYLRLSIYMAIVAVAIIVSFHLKTQPSHLELKIARPLGIIFWFLSLACLGLGFGNYIKTVNMYSRRAAIVQTGWKTQSILTVVAFSIVGVCILFLATNSQKS